MLENTAELGGAIYVDSNAPATIASCTLAFNTGTYYGGAICLMSSTNALVFENTIIADSVEGPAVMSFGGVATFSCCDIFGNEGGDWTGWLSEQLGLRGNICEDPLFCDPGTRDFRLSVGSPCAPDTPPTPECGLIGAWPVGCGSTSAEATTWGAIKAMFRQ
jgi:hypothetical protein